MKNALLVGLGGFLGCIARYLTNVSVHRMLDDPLFPYATLLVNVAGCFLIGVVGELAQNSRLVSPEMQMFLIVGLFGGFTTYSTFGHQTLMLVRDGHTLLALLNVSSHVLLGLGAVWLGILATKMI